MTKLEDSIGYLDDDITELVDYIAERNIGSYLLIAVDKEQRDYYIAYGHHKCSDHLKTLLGYAIDSLDDSRQLND